MRSMAAQMQAAWSFIRGLQHMQQEVLLTHMQLLMQRFGAATSSMQKPR
jgi:hypothetical protein